MGKSLQKSFGGNTNQDSDNIIERLFSKHEVTIADIM